MRKTAHALALALAAADLVFGLLVGLPLARASETRARVDEANAALAREPPDVAAARTALVRAATAGDDTEATGEADFLLGKLDEEQGAFEQAVDDYRRAIAAAPNTRWALRATERIDWLRARSEDHFGPLAALEQVRRDPRRAADPASVEALARQADSFPPGLVRVEARMLVAEAWLGRMHRPDLAVAVLRAVCEDPRADTLTVRLAERELVDVLVSTGRIEEAAAEARDHANRLDARFVRQVTRLLVRRKVRFGAMGILASFALLAGVGLARAGRRGTLGAASRELRKIAGPAAIFVGVVAAGGGMLASNYESGNSAPFLLLGGAVLPLVLVARAWAAVGSNTTAARIARSLLAAAATLATAFLLLDTAHPEYLAGFGL
jgi:hypothetical protein